MEPVATLSRKWKEGGKIDTRFLEVEPVFQKEASAVNFTYMLFLVVWRKNCPLLLNLILGYSWKNCPLPFTPGLSLLKFELKIVNLWLEPFCSKRQHGGSVKSGCSYYEYSNVDAQCSSTNVQVPVTNLFQNKSSVKATCMAEST